MLLLKELKLIINEESSGKILFNFRHFHSYFFQYFKEEVIDFKWNEDNTKYTIELDRHYSEDKIIIFTLKDFVDDHLNPLKNNLETILFTYTLNMDVSARNIVVKNVLTEINHITYVCEQNKTEIHLLFKVFFTTMSNEISLKYGLTNYNTSLQKNTAIKWLGNITTLTTFLIQLRNGDNTIGKRLIECDNTDLTNFLLNNFIDKDGNGLKKSSIATYFNEKKQLEKQSKRETLVIDELGFIKKNAVPKKKLNKKYPNTYPKPKGIQ